MSITWVSAPQPIGYRVWWEHHGEKLTGGTLPQAEHRDFSSESEAKAFKSEQRERHPHSVFCIEPIYSTSDAERGPKQSRRRRAPVEMTRLAAVLGQVNQLVELLETARYGLHHFNTLPDGLRRIEQVVETALPIVHALSDAASDDAEQQFFEELFRSNQADGDAA
jgi:hypothetical protein